MNSAVPPMNPALVPIKHRIATQGAWSQTALFPQAKHRAKREGRKVFIIPCDERRFAVVASDYVEASNRLTTLLR